MRWVAGTPRWVITSGIPGAGTGWIHRMVFDLVHGSSAPLIPRFDRAGERLDDYPTNRVGDEQDLRLRAALASWRVQGRGAHLAKTHYFPGSWLTAGPRFALVWVWRDLRDVIASNCAAAMWGRVRGAFVGLPRDEVARRVTERVLPVQVAVLRHLVRHRPPDSTLVVRYADACADPVAAVVRIANHVGVELASGAAESVAATHSFEAESGRPRGMEDRSCYHRLGVVGAWRETLPPVARQRVEEMVPDLDELQAAMVARYRP